MANFLNKPFNIKNLLQFRVAKSLKKCCEINNSSDFLAAHQCDLCFICIIGG